VTDDDSSAIVELRQYTLHPGGRDLLIELFEREFFESQEAVGMRLVGQFRDLDDPNRFVWLRGFPDMAARDSALRTFYGGAAWKAHSADANATMVDSTNVLLLRPARPVFGFRLEDHDPPPSGSGGTPDGTVVATIYNLEEAASREFTAFFESALAPTLRELGISLLATFETEPSPNTFPELPVREGERVFVWFCRFPTVAAQQLHASELTAGRQWGGVSEAFGKRLTRPPDVLRLSPTPRSRLRA
jgi:hypothetical protein